MAQTLANDGSSNLNSTGSGIKLRANSAGVPMSHDDVDTNFENLRAKINEVIGEVGTNTSKLSGIATGANNYSLPLATSTVRGGIELFSNTDQSVAANSASSTSGRTYGIQLNSANQAVVNVPWSNTTYSAASSSALGLSKLGSGTQQNTAANSVSSTTSRTYAVQHNSADQLVVNVPWTNTNTTYSTATSTTAGLVKIGFTESGKNYPVELSSGKMYVNVPWTDTDTNTTYTAGTGITISGTTISATGGAGVSLEGVDTGWGRTLAISGGESGDPDSGTIELGGASHTYATGNLYVVNPEDTLRVYLNQNSGVDIGSSYGTNGGNGSGIPGFRGCVRDPHDSRARAIPVKFLNFGQAEKYINMYHPNAQNIQVFFGSDITETLYANNKGGADSTATLLYPLRDERNWMFLGVKGGFSSPQVPRWTITFQRGTYNRDNILDTYGNIHCENMQFDVTNPIQWLLGTRGGQMSLKGYIGVRAAGNFSYGVWRVAEGGHCYDFSYGDIIKTAANDVAGYHYALQTGGTVAQMPYVTLGHGGLAYIVDGNYGVAKVGNQCSFLMDAYNIPHSGSDDSAVPGWPDGNNIADTTRSIDGTTQEFHQAQGPYVCYYGSDKNYEPLNETKRVPAFLFSGSGGYVGYLNGGAGVQNDVEPIPLNRFKYTQVVGNVDWSFSPNLTHGSFSNTGGYHQNALEWDPEAYGFTASQAALINWGSKLSRPIHTTQITTSNAKFRDLSYRKDGHQHGGGGFNSASGGAPNPAFVTTATYHAANNSVIPNW